MGSQVISSPGRPVLLDTCVVLDLSVDPTRVAASIARMLADPATVLLVSAASAWEIAIKTRQGRLPGGERLLGSWEAALRNLDADPVNVDHQDAIRAGSLPWTHRDPFDRMLVAQALRHNLTLATRDETILTAGIVDAIDTAG